MIHDNAICTAVLHTWAPGSLEGFVLDLKAIWLLGVGKKRVNRVIGS